MGNPAVATRKTESWHRLSRARAIGRGGQRFGHLRICEPQYQAASTGNPKEGPVQVPRGLSPTTCVGRQENFRTVSQQQAMPRVLELCQEPCRSPMGQTSHKYSPRPLRLKTPQNVCNSAFFQRPKCPVTRKASSNLSINLLLFVPSRTFQKPRQGHPDQLVPPPL
jgi:hypothetical protein